MTGHPSSIPSATEFRSAPAESPGTAGQDYVLRRRVRVHFQPIAGLHRPDHARHPGRIAWAVKSTRPGVRGAHCEPIQSSGSIPTVHSREILADIEASEVPSVHGR